MSRVEFSPELWEELLGHIAAGESLRQVCKREGMPHQGSVMRWLAKDESLQPAYAAAMAMRAEFYAEEIVDIADEDCEDAVAAARNRLRVDARKWVACKLVPKKYGEKVDMNHGGGVTLNVVTGVPDADADD